MKPSPILLATTTVEPFTGSRRPPTHHNMSGQRFFVAAINAAAHDRVVDAASPYASRVTFLISRVTRSFAVNGNNDAFTLGAAAGATGGGATAGGGTDIGGGAAGAPPNGAAIIGGAIGIPLTGPGAGAAAAGAAAGGGAAGGGACVSGICGGGAIGEMGPPVAGAAGGGVNVLAGGTLFANGANGWLNAAGDTGVEPPAPVAGLSGGMPVDGSDGGRTPLPGLLIGETGDIGICGITGPVWPGGVPGEGDGSVSGLSDRGF